MSNYEDHHMVFNGPPARGGWASGQCWCRCETCRCLFIGAKRSYQCVDCAYAPPPVTDLEKWDRRFLELAGHIAQWSKDPSTQVGAVIVRPNRTIASLGYNGFVRGFKDDPAMLADRDIKYRFVVHAEANAIVTTQENLVGTTIYTTPLPVCADCCKLAIQAGISRFVSYRPTAEQRLRWKDSFDASERMITECRLDQTLYHHEGADWPCGGS